MLKIEITDTSITFIQLLHEVEKGQDIIIFREGQPIAQLSPPLNSRHPLSSHQALRSQHQPSAIQSLDILQQLRQEAHY
ncbi:MAG: hypothetical protein IM466_14180 [Microcystis sp. M04BS1]|nr:hypothetical protein [Microcystis sp. M04BS1]